MRAAVLGALLLVSAVADGGWIRCGFDGRESFQLECSDYEDVHN